MIKNISLEDKSKYPPGLYIVSTPIGNLKDITIRALEVLNGVDIIACEDTRNSKVLLEKYSISTKTISYHDFNGEEARPRIINDILNGKSLALISDAGTPLISDPGYKLVKECVLNNIEVFTIPGSCAAISALTVAGCPSDKFHFVGFPPNKEMAKEEFFSGLKNLQGSIIFYESPKRVHETLKAVQKTMGNLQGCVARELTKLFEEKIYGTMEEILNSIKDRTLKGEIVVVLNNPAQISNFESQLEPLVTEVLKYCSVKDTSSALSKALKINKSEIYDLALRLKDGA